VGARTATPPGAAARSRPPRVFRVNLIRRDGSGRFLWLRYGDNVRVLKWIVDLIHGKSTLEIGKLADVAVLDKDAAPEVRADLVIAAGEVVLAT
jgi:GTP-dependent phosphoenolpyruvate carboxykinase